MLNFRKTFQVKKKERDFIKSEMTRMIQYDYRLSLLNGTTKLSNFRQTKKTVCS